MLCRFSPPEQLHNDQAHQFESELLNEFCTLLHISKMCIIHSAMAWWSDSIQLYWKCCPLTVCKHQANWQQHNTSIIRKLCLAYNSSIHSSTGFSPFFFKLGRQVKLLIDLMYGTTQTTTEYAQCLKQALQESYALVREQVRPNLEDRTIVHFDRLKPCVVSDVNDHTHSPENNFLADQADQVDRLPSVGTNRIS